MAVNERTLKTFKVAIYLAEKGRETGHQFTTDDTKLAEQVGEALAMAVSMNDKDKVEHYVNSMIEASEEVGPPSYWNYLCLVVNWLSWAWHENGEEELAKAWSQAWYRVDEWSRDNLSQKQLKKYLEVTD